MYVSLAEGAILASSGNSGHCAYAGVWRYMLSHGQRPRKQLGHDIAIIEFVRKNLPGCPATTFILFERMRRKRNDAVYDAANYPEDRRAHTRDEAADAPSHAPVRWCAGATGNNCQPTVPKLYPIRAAPALRAAGAWRKINNLRAVNKATGFDFHPRLHCSERIVDPRAWSRLHRDFACGLSRR